MIRAFALLVVAFPALADAQPRPAFIANSGRVVAVVLPASLLGDREIQKQLESGLTTTFTLIAHQRDSDRRGAARLEIRFDLWDEVWIVRRIEVDGKEDRQQLRSRDALEKWWTSPIRIFAATADRVTLQVTLAVLPFSASEEEDTRQWISKSGGIADGGNSPLLAALIGTTLSAKPIRSFRWQAEISFP